MRKNALTVILVTVVAGVFGAFLRWLQLMNAFETSGLMKRHAATTTAITIYLLAAAAVFAVIVFVWLKKYDRLNTVEALGWSGGMPFTVKLVLGIYLVAVCGIRLFKLGFTSGEWLELLFYAFGVAAGASLPLTAVGGGKGRGAKYASLVMVLFGCAWLLKSYRENAENPVLWSYCLEILAITAVTLGFYYTAAYFYNRAKPNAALFFNQLSACLSITTLADARSVSEQLVFVFAAAIMLVNEFILVSNMGGGIPAPHESGEDKI